MLFLHIAYDARLHDVSPLVLAVLSYIEHLPTFVKSQVQRTSAYFYEAEYFSNIQGGYYYVLF